jgi:hypothetical protein
MVIPDGDPSATDLFADLPEPVGYDLRRQRNGQPVYVAADYPECDQRPCVVPGCTSPARMTYTAAGFGRLAGRDWKPGQEILMCPAHSCDMLRARGVTDREQLPGWLRADARPSALAEFDAAQDTLTGTDFGRYDFTLLSVRGGVE